MNVRPFLPLNCLKRWLAEQVQDVPEDIALCEFDCRKPECLVGEWETCERRLRWIEEERRFRHAFVQGSHDRTGNSGQVSQR